MVCRQVVRLKAKVEADAKTKMLERHCWLYPDWMDSVHLLGDGPCFISSNSASSGCMERACPEPHVGDLPSFLYSCNLVVRRRLQMARSATMRARPTTPPATPPAIAVVFDFGTAVVVWGANWPADVAAGTLLETEVVAGTLLGNAIDVAKLCAAGRKITAPTGMFGALEEVKDDAELLGEDDIVSELEEAAGNSENVAIFACLERNFEGK